MNAVAPPFRIIATVLAIGLLAAAQSSCSLLKRSSGGAGSNALTSLLDPAGDDESSVEDLKAIADSPNAQLPPDLADAPDAAEASGGEPPENGDGEPSPTALPADPAKAWRREGVDPRAIFPGDIFTEHAGPILNKAFSVADALPEEARARWLDAIAKPSTRRVPLTLSQGEIAELRAGASADTELPTRSVALDFRTVTHGATAGRLEDSFAAIDSGSADAPGFDGAPPTALRERLAEVRQRLHDGDEFFVITAVTASDRVRATYPGAPVGKRDAEPIRNAVRMLYPHLDGLQARKEGSAITITRDPRIYWEFDVRALRLEGDRLVVVTNPPAGP